MVRSQLGQIVSETLSQKNLSQKKTGGVTQGVGLSSNPSSEKRKRKKKSWLEFWPVD
jgi:hypothetical protein